MPRRIGLIEHRQVNRIEPSLRCLAHHPHLDHRLRLLLWQLFLHRHLVRIKRHEEPGLHNLRALILVELEPRALLAVALAAPLTITHAAATGTRLTCIHAAYTGAVQSRPGTRGMNEATYSSVVIGPRSCGPLGTPPSSFWPGAFCMASTGAASPTDGLLLPDWHPAARGHTAAWPFLFKC